MSTVNRNSQAARAGEEKREEKSLIVFLSDLGDMLVVSAPKDSRVANILIISGTQSEKRGDEKKKERRCGWVCVSVSSDR